MIKAIIFDLDNTLIDFLHMKRMSLQAAAYAMIDAGLAEKSEKIVADLVKLLDRHGYEDQQVFQRYLKRVSGKVDYRTLAHGINAYRRVRTGFLEPFPHVRSTLLALKKRGIELAIVSDAPKLKAWLRLSAMKIDHFFDIVVAYEDTKELKPSTKPFKVALDRLNIPAHHCLMVGDMPHKDIRGANRLGMLTCFAKYGNLKISGKTGADYEISDISQILDIIAKPL